VRLVGLGRLKKFTSSDLELAAFQIVAQFEDSLWISIEKLRKVTKNLSRQPFPVRDVNTGYPNTKRGCGLRPAYPANLELCGIMQGSSR
jgi:hypothetical protein